MKKKVSSCICGVVCCCLVFCSGVTIIAQNSIVLSGVVVKSASNSPIKDVVIRVKTNQDKFAYTDKNGRFSLKTTTTGSIDIEISSKGFLSQYFLLEDIIMPTYYLGTVVLFEKQEELIYSNTLELSDDDLLDNDIGGSNVITGLLQSSKDVFLRTAAFNFGQARFKIRGYDSREGTVLINGIKMNKIQTGRPQWSNWGGLNDALRNFTFSNGIAPSPISFGSVLGLTNFKTKATEYRPGSSLSLAASNGSYRGRLMASHFTGINSKNWAFAFSVSSRFANKGTLEGTHYKAYSALFSAEKIINKKHKIGFTAIYAFNQRGKSSANTQEVIDLKGSKYNSYWGVQEGKVRNSRIQSIEEPLFQLMHDWSINKNFSITTTLSYQFGQIASSRLGYSNVKNPDPSYYKYVPSYPLQYANYSDAYTTEKYFINNGQVDWTELYQTNYLTETASYYLYEDRIEDQQFSFRSNMHKLISKDLNLDAAIGYRKMISNNYAQVLDVFGTNGFLDLDSFETGDSKQSDLNNIDRTVFSGDAFLYKYEVEFSEFEALLQATYKWKKIEFVSAINYNQTKYLRNGLYKNGKYPDNSFGKGIKQEYNNLSFKLNTLYKFSGRHLLYSNIAMISRAPLLKNSFSNIRISNQATPNIESESIKTVDVSYQYRAPKIKSRLTIYHTLFSKGTENSFLFAQGLTGDHSDFIAQIVTDIEKQHKGVELGVDIELNSEISLTAVAAIGEYTHSNNPNLFVVSDLYNSKQSDFGTVYLKDYKIGGSPQRAYSLGVSYRDPDYWWIALNGNLLTHHYLSVSPLLRTANFYLDSDGVPFVDETTGKQISNERVSELLQQERFDDLFLVNLVGGKSWRLKGNYIGLFVSINNILGEVYKTGGYEQSRKANFKELSKDQSLSTPLFGPKYWVQNGTGYYVILSYRF